MDRMKEVTGFETNGSHLSVSNRIHPVNPVHPVARLLWLPFDSAQGLELAETAALSRGAICPSQAPTRQL
jgi:hypothetical protein